MSLEKITAKILADAHAEAKKETDEARSLAEGILAEARKKAEKIVADAKIRGEVDQDKQLASRKAVAVIDGRNLALEQQQKVIGECFDEAIASIGARDQKDYLDFLEQCVRASGCTQGEIILNSKDREALGSALLERLNGANGDFVLSEETKSIAGGLMIRVGKTYQNISIDAVVEEIHDDIIGEVAQVLFPDREK